MTTTYGTEDPHFQVGDIVEFTDAQEAPNLAGKIGRVTQVARHRMSPDMIFVDTLSATTGWFAHRFRLVEAAPVDDVDAEPDPWDAYHAWTPEPEPEDEDDDGSYVLGLVPILASISSGAHDRTALNSIAEAAIRQAISQERDWLL